MDISTVSTIHLAGGAALLGLGVLADCAVEAGEVPVAGPAQAGEGVLVVGDSVAALTRDTGHVTRDAW